MSIYEDQFIKEERNCWYDMMTMKPADPTTPEEHLLQFKFFDDKTQRQIAWREWQEAFED
jgi:hypothetical protein